MKNREPRKDLEDLPLEIDRTIRAEIEAGLASFRAGDFEDRLVFALRHRPIRFRPSMLWRRLRLAPVYGFVLAAAAVAAALIWFGRTPGPSPSGLDSALSDLPGFRSLSAASLYRVPSAGTVSPVDATLAAILTEVFTPSLDNRLEAESPPLPSPRFSLQQKIEILVNERPIERALFLIIQPQKES